MKIAFVQFQCVVTNPVMVRDDKGVYLLSAAVHGALGREFLKKDASFDPTLFRRANAPAPTILRRVLYANDVDILPIGEQVDIELACFGDAAERVEGLIEPMALALENGIGGPASGERTRGRMLVISARRMEQPKAPSTTHAALLRAYERGAVVRFVTPVSLKWLEEPRAFGIEDLSKALYQRLEKSLVPAYRGELSPPSKEAWRALSAEWRWAAEDRWSGHLWDGRRSGPSFSGVVGEFEICGDARAVVETLWHGAWTGIGEGTAMGMGQFEVSPLFG